MDDDDDGPGFTLSDALPTAVPNGVAGSGKRRNGGAGETRVRRRDAVALLLSDVDLWRGEDGAAFASVPTARGGREHFAVNSKGFRNWVTRTYHERHGGALSGTALAEAAGLAEARALTEGETRTAWRRVALEGGRIWLDLGGGALAGERRAVEIGPERWRVVDGAPVAFLRGPDALPLPEPEQDAARPGDLLRFANVGDGEGLALAWAWLCCAARPFAGGAGAAYPLLLLHGQQGSGKSNATRRLQALLDPAKSAGRGLPREDRDLFVSALARHLLAFDNVSALNDWFSDSLCRIATGGAFSARALHTDADEVVLAAARPLLLNGIPSTILHRPDLADRAIALECRPLRGERRTDAELDAEFARVRPGLLGLLCDALSAGLRRLDAVRLADPPRMADAATWAEACAAGLDFAEGSVAEAWRANREASTRAALDADDVAAAVLALLGANGGKWSGAPAELYRRLCDHTSERVSRGPLWPKNPAGMGTKLKRIAPGLREALGIEVEWGRGADRWWSVRRV